MFANPLGLLALLGVPAVLGLHLFRRRFRPRAVSALHLWQDVVDSPVAGRRRERLRSSASLWLELLAVLLLALAFAGPKGCAGAEVAHLVVVLDSSASMTAVTPEGPTLAAVRGVVRERLDGLGAGARATLVATGRRPRLLVGPAAPASVALARLDDFRAGALRHDPGPALALARELASQRAVLYLTDHHDPERADLPSEVEVVSVGRPAPNVGIVHATRSRERGEDGVVERALVTVQAFTDDAQRRTLVVEGPSGELARRELTLLPDAREHLTFPLPEGYPAVTVRLLGADALALDDAVPLAPEPRRVVRVGTTLPDAAAERLGLGDASGPLGRLARALPDVEAVADAGAAQLVLGEAPAAASVAWSLRLPLATATDAPEEPTRRDLVGPFLADKRHPLLAGVTLEGLVWSIDPALALPGAPLVSAGNQPILTEVVSGSRRTLWANLDLGRSTLVRSPDWAILLANLVEARRAELPGPRATNVAVGEDFVLRGQRPGDFVVTRLGGNEPIELRTGGDVVTLEAVPAPGRYEVRRADEPSAPPLAEFAAQFQDASESDLRGRRTGTSGGTAAAATATAEANPLVAAAAALALLLALADWWVLGRTGRRIAPGSARR